METILTTAHIDPAIRFTSKYEKRDSGCWHWTAGSSIMARTNNRIWRYGWFRPGGKAQHVLAHRWAYETYNGLIPPGMVIDHLCRNTLCVNPAHLEAVTVQENLARGDNANLRKTHCKRGHLFDIANTYISGGGGRYCRKCKAWHQRNRNRRLKAETI